MHTETDVVPGFRTLAWLPKPWFSRMSGNASTNATGLGGNRPGVLELSNGRLTFYTNHGVVFDIPWTEAKFVKRTFHWLLFISGVVLAIDGKEYWLTFTNPTGGWLYLLSNPESGRMRRLREEATGAGEKGVDFAGKAMEVARTPIPGLDIGLGVLAAFKAFKGYEKAQSWTAALAAPPEDPEPVWASLAERPSPPPQGGPRQWVAWAGAALLLVGIFLPFASVYDFSTGNQPVSMVQDPGGIIVGILALASAVLAYLKRYGWLWITGGIPLALILIDIAANNTSAGGAVLWGWVVLVPAAIMVLIAAGLPGGFGMRQRVDADEPDGSGGAPDRSG